MAEPRPESKYLDRPGPCSFHYTPLPLPLRACWFFTVLSPFPEEEIVRDAAAYGQGHVHKAWPHGCECGRRCVGTESLPGHLIDSQGRVGGPGPATFARPSPVPAAQSLTRSHSCFKALRLFRAVCYCLCHHKFKKGKLIKYGTRLSNIF